MEIRDPVHGSIHIEDYEIPVIEHSFFQRLRGIKQLGFAEYVFPGATHSRYLHSIGVMHIASKIFNSLFKQDTPSKELDKLKATLRLAALLHDVGHAPLSHTTEFVMPSVGSLKLPAGYSPNNSARRATHEDYTLKAILDSSFSESFQLVNSELGVEKERIADLIRGETSEDSYYQYNGINFFPLLHQIISSEMDSDRMDYLLRDSYFCGVSYGKYDLDWLIDNLKVANENGTAYLGLERRALSTFDDFLLCRFHMFIMVYFHYKAVVLEKLLKRYFQEVENEYQIPADIEEYQNHDDNLLIKTLRNSSNVWAKRIIANDLPQKIYESFSSPTDSALSELTSYLGKNDIDYIVCSSSNRLSKYYQSDLHSEVSHPIKVMSQNSLTKETKTILNINEATDLYEKFKENHTITRIHCDFLSLSVETQNDIKRIIS